MILEQKVHIKINDRYKQYYINRGYLEAKSFLEFEIDVKDLQPYSRAKILVKCDDCYKTVLMKYESISRKFLHKCRSCIAKDRNIKVRKHFDKEYTCENCQNKFIQSTQKMVKRLKYSKNKQVLCRKCIRKECTKALPCRYGSEHPKWNPNRKEFLKYRDQVQKITEETYRQFKHFINPNNVPRTLCGTINGYQLDHKISVKTGFENNIAPEIIGALNNLQMLPWLDNLTKSNN